jgi:hypothetical protein
VWRGLSSAKSEYGLKYGKMLDDQVRKLALGPGSEILKCCSVAIADRGVVGVGKMLFFPRSRAVMVCVIFEFFLARNRVMIFIFNLVSFLNFFYK